MSKKYPNSEVKNTSDFRNSFPLVYDEGGFNTFVACLMWLRIQTLVVGESGFSQFEAAVSDMFTRYFLPVMPPWGLTSVLLDTIRVCKY